MLAFYIGVVLTLYIMKRIWYPYINASLFCQSTSSMHTKLWRHGNSSRFYRFVDFLWTIYIEVIHVPILLITWTIVGRVSCRHMASIGHAELTTRCNPMSSTLFIGTATDILMTLIPTLLTKSIGPTWDPPGADRDPWWPREPFHLGSNIVGYYRNRRM